jgi:hypothetical protein
MLGFGTHFVVEYGFFGAKVENYSQTFGRDARNLYLCIDLDDM